MSTAIGGVKRPPDHRGRPVVRALSRWSKLPAGAVVCAVCEQWYSYGTSMIGPCAGSAWYAARRGPGRRDPLHDWVELVEGPLPSGADDEGDVTLRHA